MSFVATEVYVAPTSVPQEDQYLLLNEDDAEMNRLGYKQELLRGFSGLMSFTFCFTAVAVLSSISILFNFGLSTGGPAVMVWGWVISSAFTIIVGLCMAEICSTYPSAGSVYHWAGQLARREHAPLASYVTGWFNFLGNAAGDATFAYGFVQLLSAAVSLGGGSAFDNDTGVWIAIAVCLAWSLQNATRIDQQGWLNNFAALWQLGTAVVVIVSVLVAPPERQTSEFVFTSTYNTTGFGSMTYVCCIGLLMALFSFSGYEAGAHMAEETRDAGTAAPWGVVICVVLSAVTGLLYIVGLLFATLNIDDALNGQSQSALVEVFLDAVGKPGALALTSLLIVNLYFSGMSSLTVTSRICFAMVRDNALPGSSFLYAVNPVTKMPLRAVALVFVLDAALLALGFVNSTAFSAVTSISTIGYQISYAIPIFLRVTDGKTSFRQGKFSLGRWSLPLGWIASLWLIGSSFLFLLPTVSPVTPSSMNYCGVVVCGTLILCGIYWWTLARHWFKGPPRPDSDMNCLEEPLTGSRASSVHNVKHM